MFQTNNTFGQPNQSSTAGTMFGQSLFGQQTQPQQQNSVFANKPLQTGFGTFGASSTATTGTSSIFGSTSQATGSTMFGSNLSGQSGSGSIFGGGNLASSNSGTSLSKFNPPTSIDTIQKSGTTHNINTKHQCICAMKEYEAKSLEELRMEDYSANRKGPSPGGIGSTFGGLTQTSTAGSLFGNTANTSSSLFGATGTNSSQNKPLFGGTSTGTTFGGGTSIFGSSQPNKPSGTLFGASATTSGALNLFGAPQQASAANTGFTFGQPSTSSAAGSLFGKTPAFGTPTTSSNLGTSMGFSFNNPAQQSTGLFGAAKPATSLFGGVGTSTFGAPASSAATPFSFNPTSSAAGTTGLFGQQNQAKPAFGFGATPASGSSTGFGFGTNTATPSLGFGTPAGGTSLFGAATQNKPFFGGTGALGSTANTSSAFSFGGNTGTGLNLGGGLTQTQQPAFGFNTGSAFGGGSSLFGNQQQPQATTIGLSSDPQQALAEQARIQQQVFDLVRSMPYGHSDLFKSSFLGSGSTPDNKSTTPSKSTGLLTGSAAAKGAADGRSPAGINRLSIKPVSRPQMKLLPHSRKMLFSGFDEEDFVRGSSDNFFQRRSQWKRLDLRASTLSGSSIDRQSIIGSEQARPSSPVGRCSSVSHTQTTVDDDAPADKKEDSHTPVHEKIYPDLGDLMQSNNESGTRLGSSGGRQLVAKKRTSAASSTSTPLPSKPSGVPHHSPFDSNNSFSPRNHLALDSSSMLMSDATLWNNDPDSSVQPDSSVTSLKYPGGSGVVQPPHPCGLVLTKPGYFTLPTLEEIGDQGLDSKQECWIEDFVIGRKSYGRILFPGKTNVANLNIDDNVHIRRKEVTVYPDDDNKPPVGQSINRMAEITLDRVWPTDKTTRQPIEDPERLIAMNFEQKLEKNTQKMGARFIEYRPDTGSWVFEVKHFSKYRYEDSDDEDDVPKPVKPTDETKVNTVTVPSIQTKPDDVKLAKPVQDAASKEETTKLGVTVKTPSSLAPPVLRLRTKPSAVSTPRGAVSSTTELEGASLKLTPVAPQIPSSTVQLDEGSEDEVIDLADSSEEFSPSSSDKESEDSKAARQQPDSSVPEMIPQTGNFQTEQDANTSMKNMQRMKLSLFADMDDEEEEAIPNDLSLYRHPKRASLMTAESAPQMSYTSRWQSTTRVVEPPIHVDSSFLRFQSDSPGLPRVPSVSSTVSSIPAQYKLPPTQLPNRKPLEILPSGMPHPGTIPPKPRIPRHLKLPTGACRLPLSRKNDGDFADIARDSADHIGVQLSRLLFESSCFQQTSQRVSWCLFSGHAELQSFSYLAPKCHSTTADGRPRGMGNILISSVEHPDNEIGHLHPNGQQISIEALHPQCDDIDEDLLNRALRSSNCIVTSEDREAMDDDSTGSSDDTDEEFVDINNAPLWKPKEDLAPLNCYRESIKECKSDSFRRLVSLCCELWAELSVSNSSNDPESETTKSYTRMERAQALSRWIRNEVQDEVKSQMETLTDATERVFALLTSGDLRAACREAQDLGLERTARLISSCVQGGKVKKRMLLQQLQMWRGDDDYVAGPSDEFIPDSQIKLFALLCGLTEWEKSNGDTVHVLKDLDWLRSFAVFFWFNPDAQTANIDDAINAYKRAFKSDGNNGIVAKPWAIRASSPTRQWDSAYHLLQLYCKRSHRLEKLLDPGAMSSSSGHQQGLDWQTSWHLWRILDALRYSHLSELRSSQLHTEWAAQLQNSQLWEWGVFALLHIRNTQLRNSSVKSFLARHVSLDVTKELSHEEEFIVTRLRVPEKWIHEAKAVLARHRRLYELEAHHWYQAGHYDKAHSLYMEHMAPEYLISKRLDDVEEIFAKFVHDKISDQVCDWYNGGGLYLDHVQINRDVLDLGDFGGKGSQESGEQDLEYRLQTLRLKLCQVIDRLDALPSSTPRDRLVRSECSLYCSRLLDLLVKHTGGMSKQSLYQRATLVRDLALSDDKRIQELKAISACMDSAMNCNDY